MSVSRWLGYLAAGAVAASVGCSEGPATQPSGTPANSVRLALAVQVATTGKTLRVGIAYQHAGAANASVPLFDQLIDVGVQAHAVPLVVDIAPCLADAQREGATSDGLPACVLHIVVDLLGSANEQLDQAA